MTYNEDILKDLSQEERNEVLKILNEFSETGESKSYENILYNDYEEIPVTIEEFLHNRKYLGNALYDPDGRFTLFPYWENKLKDIFPNNIDTKYNTIVLTGAIGLGKSTVAVICQLYLLYRLLCLRDPYLYYGMQPIDKISISLMNITLENAKGVALDKMNQMILSSEWFMQHGKMTGETNLVFKPDKHIEIIAASSNNQIIGRAIFCLDGDTKILTTNGEQKIEDLVDKNIKVISIDDKNKVVASDTCTVKPTIQTNEEYEIELEDGTVIKCTADHLLMLADGTYKAAKDLTEDDELAESNGLCLSTYLDFINNIIKTRGQWNIPVGEYFEAHHIIPTCIGGSGTVRTHGHTSKHQNIIWLYPEEHFIAHKLLALENPKNKGLVLAWSMMAFPKGKTKRDTAITAEEYAELRKLQAVAISGKNNPMYGKVPWNKGKTNVYSEETLQKLRQPRESMRGVPKSKETRKNMSVAQRLRYQNNPESHSKPTLDKIAITNGLVCKYINKNKELPEGFVYGQGQRDHYIIKNPKEFSKQKSLQTRGENNPNYGNGYKISGGKNGHAIYIYTFEDKDYDCRDALMVVLKERWPDISESAIRRIQQNNYGKCIIRKYGYVIENLTWRLKSNED